MQPGKVFLVGAGPGHRDLITVKAKELLERADAVVFDRLVQEELLEWCRPGVRRLYVGKAPGRHESRQGEINDLLVRLAGEHRLVVRLKGGDPLLFGRGGEEAEELARQGVPFEIVPGVTSALAAPAAAGIPVTHRGHACSLAIVTGHEREGACEGRIDWAALARIDTVVVLMGVKALGRISSSLVEAGRSADTPAAVVESAFWASERVVVGTLGTIADLARREGVQPPATLVIGEVVRLRDRLAQVRELARTAGTAQPAPGPSAASLERVVAGVRHGRQLAAALAIDLFDDLEDPRSPEELAAARGLDPRATGELCADLVAAGLLVGTADRVRNAEVASRFLRRASPAYVGAALLAQLQGALGAAPPAIVDLATASPSPIANISSARN